LIFSRFGPIQGINRAVLSVPDSWRRGLVGRTHEIATLFVYVGPCDQMWRAKVRLSLIGRVLAVWGTLLVLVHQPAFAQTFSDGAGAEVVASAQKKPVRRASRKAPAPRSRERSAVSPAVNDPRLNRLLDNQRPIYVAPR